MQAASEMLAVSRTAQRLASGYYAFLVAQLVAANPQSINSLPPAKVLGEDPTGEVNRKDGTRAHPEPAPLPRSIPRGSWCSARGAAVMGYGRAFDFGRRVVPI